MIATAPLPSTDVAIARLWPLAMGAAFALTVSLAGSWLSGSVSFEGAGEAPNASCVGCHTVDVPEGGPEGTPTEPGASALRRLAECQR